MNTALIYKLSFGFLALAAVGILDFMGQHKSQGPGYSPIAWAQELPGRAKQVIGKSEAETLAPTASDTAALGAGANGGTVPGAAQIAGQVPTDALASGAQAVVADGQTPPELIEAPAVVEPEPAPVADCVVTGGSKRCKLN